MPTRRIRACPVKVTGTAPDGQQFESLLEEDFFVLLRFNRLVAEFKAQPVKVEWQDAEGSIRTYTPDALVHYRQDLPESASRPPLLCEVKPVAPGEPKKSPKRMPPRKEDDAENLLKWAAAERYAARRGWAFKVFFEKDIRTPYLENARFLLRYKERMGDSKYQDHLLDVLERRGPLTLAEWAASLSSSLEERAQVLPACYRLIALQQVSAGLDRRLSLNSQIGPIFDAS